MAQRLQNGSVSMFDTLKEKFNAGELADKIKGSKETFLWGALYGGVGFLVGFFFKQFSWYFAVFLIFIGALLGLQHAGILTVVINQAKLSSILGIQSIATHDQVIMMFIAWVKANVFITFAFVVGFLLGIRVG